MRLLLVGINHRSATVEIREKFAAGDSRAALEKLVDCPEIEEAVLISTCNRVEIIATTYQIQSARHRLESFFVRELAGDTGISPVEFEQISYVYQGNQAVGHVFRVASAIDSMVVGEPQILGQIKDAYREAADVGAAGPVLSRLFQRAFATAKRVKNETRIAERPVSVARVAVDLARKIFEDLSGKSALLIGAGEMIEAALFALHREGLGECRIANRTRENAQELAMRFGGSAHGLDELDALLADSDVVLTCIGGDGPLISADRIAAALRGRRNRPIFLIDIGVPRNIAADVNDLDSAYLYDIDDLREVAASNAEHRERESSQGANIVLQEQERFDGWLVALRSVPTIRHLRARAEAVRRTEIDRHSGRLRFSKDQLEGVEQLTRSIVNKILHPPVSRLREETDRDAGLARLEAARVLFALDDPTAPGAEADEHVFALRSVGPEMLEPDLLPEAEGDMSFEDDELFERQNEEEVS